MSKKAIKEERVHVRITVSQLAYLEKQVEAGKAKNLSDAVQQLINKAMLLG
ncbi:hypothetical protein [Aeromonas salmonicida]|uniref:hypothetical protein n=1 Tax=Aeromonas salmonicida TaxID=645 RepID=UPI003D25ABA3